MTISFVRFALAISLAAATLQAGANVAIAGSKENFKASDSNSDGALNRREFRRFIIREARDGTGQAPRIKELNMYDDAFNMVDRNNDNRFTPNEAPEEYAAQKREER